MEFRILFVNSGNENKIGSSKMNDGGFGQSQSMRIIAMMVMAMAMIVLINMVMVMGILRVNKVLRMRRFGWGMINNVGEIET